MSSPRRSCSIKLKGSNHVVCLLSSPLLSSPNTPTRVAKGASQSAHQQRDGALFKALVDNTHPNQRQIISSITDLIGRLSPEIIPANDQTGFFSNVNVSPEGYYSFTFNNVYGFGIENLTHKGLLIAVGEHLPKVRAIDEIEKTKEIISDPKLKEQIDSLEVEMITHLTKPLPDFTIGSKEDLLRLIQAVVLSFRKPWNEENIAKVETKINEYFPFLDD